MRVSRRAFVGGVGVLLLDPPSQGYPMTMQSPVGTNGLPASIVSLGNLSKLQSVLLRAQAGLPINVGFLGGSITARYNASIPENRWSSLVVAQISALFGTVATEINCGIGGTNSDYGALRVDRDVTSRGLHLFFLEYAVNDTVAQRPSYESIIRRVIAACPGVAIVPVMVCNCSLQNVQDDLIPVCDYYDLPTVSYRDLAQALIAAGSHTIKVTNWPNPNNRPGNFNWICSIGYTI